MDSRILKIEEDGDFWRGTVKPKIRLKGQWRTGGIQTRQSPSSEAPLARRRMELRSSEPSSEVSGEAPLLSGGGS